MRASAVSARGCANQLFSLSIQIEKASEYHRPLHVCFIDLQKAYDSVNREALWTLLQSPYGLPAKLVSVIKALHAGSTAAVRAYRKVSEGFYVMCGVRQGCILASTFFNLYFDAIIQISLDSHRAENKDVGVAYCHDAKLVGNHMILQLETLVTDLEYADDMALLADSWGNLEAMLTSLSSNCCKFGLLVSSA